MDKITSRAIIGMYYQELEANMGAAWLDAVSNYFQSDQESEEYAWLDQVPALREWVGGRHAKGFTENGIEIKNKHFEATIEFRLRDMRRDKTNQIQARIGELAERDRTHWASLISLLIVNGASTVCYDGQYFFDTDHSEGSSGNQSNSIQVDISALPATVHGSAAAAPSPEEMQQAILTGITQMFKFVDDKGEPLNETAASFTVIVPVGLSQAALAAISMVRAAAASTFNIQNFNIALAINPRLTAAGWTTKFVVVRTDGKIKPFIRQEETGATLKVKDENSEFAFDNDAVQFGIDTWRNVGYGRWQGAVLVELI